MRSDLPYKVFSFARIFISSSSVSASERQNSPETRFVCFSLTLTSNSVKQHDGSYERLTGQPTLLP